jgi:fucose permease
MKIVKTKEGISYFWPFVLVTSLFFLWGFAHSILDVLNKHFQEVLVISKAKSALIQAVVTEVISLWHYRQDTLLNDTAIARSGIGTAALCH